MNYSRFVDNFKVSNICYGTWNLSRSTKKFPSPGSFNKRQSIKLINFAKNSGINFLILPIFMEKDKVKKF